ncbi:uncharacterized protein LOC115800772 isoform X2 [Archocentrus centrarchus]|uniref:uncharacterized protein LOC115800772 isoform X2 n=1 Tax=Archocentrus centrarchus TaxID=63155 RepID=UPI0011EA01E8|nr:uncharacterized protein LOC115800772 isoform X2 [Archocentrus centrarchus]
MTCVPLLLCLSLLLHSAFPAHPPAPVNLRVNSLNFHHILRWDPGSGTPPGTEYGVFLRNDQESWDQLSILTAETSMRVVLPFPDSKYYLFVQAFYNQTSSPRSKICTFSPYAETKIGPPQFSLAGFENSIRINISMPQADGMSGVHDIQDYYFADFKISYRRGKDGKELLTQSKNVTLENLKRGEEYCVQVMLKINMNEHTQPSAWKCTFTTPVDLQGGLISGMVTGIPIAVIFILTSCLIVLFYAGVICKLREAVPRALRTALTKGYILTPEPTIPDLIIVSSGNGEPNNPATSPSADRDADSEDDDDDDDKHYVNRGAGLSSGESSHADSGSMSMNSESAAALDPESSRLFAEVKVKALPAEFEEQVEAEGADGCWVKERDQKVWGQCRDEEGVKEDEVPPDTSSNVNLFSVTLASMAAHDEEEEETIADSSIESRLECLPATDSQTESGDHPTPQVLSTCRDFTEGRCTDTFTEEEEEEEEEFSLYLRNR